MAECDATVGDWDLPDLPLDKPDVDLQQRADELGIKYFLVSYAPLNTSDRISVIPRRAIRDVQCHGCGMAPAPFFDIDISDPEMYILPDARTLIQLPWRPEYAWLSRYAQAVYDYGCTCMHARARARACVWGHSSVT